MLIRSSRLPKNQSAGWLDEAPLRTVNQRPPKKIAPSNTPAASAGARNNNSFIVILLFVPYLLVFFGHPMPRIQTADREPGHQQRQRPGMLARITLVQPDTERRAEQRWNHHRPADQPHHAQAEPDARRGVTPRLEFARRLRADLLTERRLRLQELVLGVVRHCEKSPCGA